MPVIGNEIGLTLDQIAVATDFTAVSETLRPMRAPLQSTVQRS